MYLDDSSNLASYYKTARNGIAWSANAAITAPVAYSTAAGIGGPLLWNNTAPGGSALTRVMAVILGVSIGWTTAPAATGAMGIATGSGQTAVPTSTTAITGVANLRADIASSPLCNVYNVGTVTNAAKSILVTHSISTAGTPAVDAFVPLDGLVLVPPGCWAAVCAEAAIASLVAQCSLVWAEVPF